MKRAVFVLAVMALAGCTDDAVLPVAPLPVVSPPDAAAPAYLIAPAEAAAIIAPIRDRYALPAMGVLVFRGDTVIAEGVSGVRKLGDPTLATRADLFAIGQGVQAMTATLAAMLVEDGRVAWSTTLGDVFPGAPASYRGVTLEALMGQRGGVPNAIPRLARPDAVQAILNAGSDGSLFEESDASVLLAAAMLEARGGASWETLLATRLLGPLGITTCAFVDGDAGSAPSVPWGHVEGVAVAPGSDAEPTRAASPAAGIRCSLEDWGRFAAFHLRGARSVVTPLLAAPSFAKLQTPFDFNHALGWSAVSRAWAGAGLAMNVRSRSGDSCALVWVLPAKDTAVLVAMNQGGAAAEKATDDVVAELVGAFVPKE